MKGVLLRVLFLLVVLSCRNEFDVLQQDEYAVSELNSNQVFSSKLISVQQLKKEIDWGKSRAIILFIKRKRIY